LRRGWRVKHNVGNTCGCNRGDFNHGTYHHMNELWLEHIVIEVDAVHGEIGEGKQKAQRGAS
jgi:hypothetical protein